MLTCDFVLQAALKRLAFPAEAQECIWRVSDILLVSLSDRTSSNVTIFFVSGMMISIFSTGACLRPPSWQHQLQRAGKRGNRGDGHLCSAHSPSAIMIIIIKQGFQQL